ncbi:MAG: hypothetical protein F4X57_00290 [Chloroflexi bacterium]|nr:hypothetical protein [Chloroflexota bacterium]
MEATFEMTGLRGEAGGSERGILVRRYGERELLIRAGLTTDTQSTYAYINRSEALALSDAIRVMARTLEYEEEAQIDF